MASIPLPALGIKPVEQPDLMANYGRLMQLRGLQQSVNLQAQEAPYRQQLMQQQAQAGEMENQQRAIQLKDQQAMTSAMQQWDGKSIDELPTLVLKNGGSAQAVMGLKQQSLAMKEKYSQIAAQDATTGSQNLKSMSERNGMIAGKLASLEQVPDNQLGQAITQGAQDLIQQGLLDPQHGQMAAQIAQMPPIQARAALENMRKGLLSDSQLLEDAQKQAQTAQEKAQAEKTELENQQIKQYGGLTGPASDAKYRFLEQKAALGQPLTPEDQAYVKAYEKQKLLVPAATANIHMESYGQSREYPVFDKKQGTTVMVTPMEINRAAKEEPGRYTAASYAPEAVGARDTTEYFTKGKGGQQLTAFNTALQHLDTLDKLSGDLNNSNIQVFNKAAQAWAEQTGNPAPANFAAAKNAMSGEVAAALKASGATDQEIDNVSQTFSRAQSPAQLKGAIDTYRGLLKSKAGNLQKQYSAGMQGKPAFQGGGSVIVVSPEDMK